MTDTTPTPIVSPALLLVTLGCVLVVALVALGGVLVAYTMTFGGQVAPEHSRWGEFGDFIGGTLNPFYSLLALLALLLTIVLQNQELTNSARELARSVRAMEDQASAIKLQNVERTFFEMVRLHHDIVRALDLRDDASQVTTAGRDCFGVFYDRFKKRHAEANTKHNSAGQQIIVNKAWDAFFPRHQHEIGHYFRNFHRILKFIDESDVVNKANYTGILRAQMSTYELALLFYNALHPTGQKMKPLIERYQMLENLAVEILCNPPDEIPLISRSAFGEQDLSAIRISA